MFTHTYRYFLFLYFTPSPHVQYMFDITTDEHDSVMVSVEQRDVKADWVAVGENKNTIGFYIIQVGYVVKKSTEVELRRFQRSQCRKGKVLALNSLGRGFESGAPRLIRKCIVRRPLDLVDFWDFLDFLDSWDL